MTTPISSAESFSLLKHYLFFFSLNPTDFYQQEELANNLICKCCLQPGTLLGVQTSPPH